MKTVTELATNSGPRDTPNLLLGSAVIRVIRVIRVRSILDHVNKNFNGYVKRFDKLQAKIDQIPILDLIMGENYAMILISKISRFQKVWRHADKQQRLIMMWLLAEYLIQNNCSILDVDKLVNESV